MQLEPRQKVKHNTSTKENSRQPEPRQTFKKLKVPRQRHFSKVGTPDYIAP
jgi:hypothetical protein